MSVKGFAFFAHHFTEPLAHQWTIDVIVIHPAFVSRVVRRIYIDALNLASVVGQKCFQCDEIIPLDNEVAAAGIATGEFGHVFKQMERDGLMMVHHRLFPNPIKGRHRLSFGYERTQRCLLTVFVGTLVPEIEKGRTYLRPISGT